MDVLTIDRKIKAIRQAQQELCDANAADHWRIVKESLTAKQAAQIEAEIDYNPARSTEGRAVAKKAKAKAPDTSGLLAVDQFIMDWYDLQLTELNDQLHNAIKTAVLPKGTEMALVFEDGVSRNQPREEYYRETNAAFQAAKLTARGFTTEVRMLNGKAQVWANVHVDYIKLTAKFLEAWYLDPVRMLATVGPANLKVLFNPYFPYAGRWDWPADQLFGRDSDLYKDARANEEAHLAQA